MMRRIVMFALVALPLSAFFAPDDLTLEKAGAINETTLYLKYQSHESDYLVFYDREGSTLLLRYRLDRWDYANDDLRAQLQQGITYRVRMQNLKNLADGELPKGVRGEGLPKASQTRKIRKIRDIYLASLAAVSESALRDLRY